MSFEFDSRGIPVTTTTINSKDTRSKRAVKYAGKAVKVGVYITTLAVTYKATKRLFDD